MEQKLKRKENIIGEKQAKRKLSRCIKMKE